VYHICGPRSIHGLTPFTDSCFMYATAQTRIGRRRIISCFTPLRFPEYQKTGDQFSGVTYRFLCLCRAYKIAPIA
jgi:hypothetical protein